MSEKQPSKVNPEVNRRDFMRLSGLAGAGMLLSACGGGGGEAAAPATAGEAATGGEAAAPAAAEGLTDIARDRTLIIMSDGVDGQFTSAGVANPYATGGLGGHRAIPGSFEPLFYYSAFADELIPWLATDAEYNEDYTELVVNIREGVEWSDGNPFTAEDVRFTIQMLIDSAPELRNSSELASWISTIEAVDDLTVRIVFNDPRPRFLFSHLYGKFDTGIWWVPAHVFQDVEDVAGFTFYGEGEGESPVVTGPYNVVSWTPQQQIIDRRDDWWAAKIGFAELPQPERIIKIPWTGEERGAQLVINNEVDTCLDLRATTIAQTVNSNAEIITHTDRELPLGYIDWWPTSFWFNTDEEPFNSADVRWAVSYTIDRQQMLDVALEGSGILTQLPFPYYPPLQPYIDAAADLVAQYDTSEHNLDKAAERMQAAGYTRDGEFWTKDGAPIEAVIHGFGIFNDIGPVLAEQLRRGGFQADYVTPADSGTRMADGTAKILLFGHGGSIADPFDTLDMYTSKYYRPTGEPAPYFSRYQNEEYDAILEEMAALAPSPDDPAYMDLYLQALEIYLRDLIDCPIQQWLHRIPMNQTYWTNWPTESDNYVNGAFWHQTFGMILHNLKAKS